MYTHRKFDSQNGPFEPESKLYIFIKLYILIKKYSFILYIFFNSNICNKT